MECECERECECECACECECECKCECECECECACDVNVYTSMLIIPCEDNVARDCTDVASLVRGATEQRKSSPAMLSAR